MVQKFKPPKPGKESDYAPVRYKKEETGPICFRPIFEPQHPDVTLMRKRLRKKQEQVEKRTENVEK